MTASHELTINCKHGRNRRGTAWLPVTILLVISGTVAAAGAGPFPERFVSRGPGGGGAFFAPAVNPFAPGEIWVGSDMSDLFVSKDFGRAWDTVDFRILQGGSRPGRMAFTSNPLVRYALDDSVPMRTTDGGATWTAVPRDIWSPWVYGLWADPTTTNRLLTADYTTLYLSTDSGATWKGVQTNSDQLIAGAFWDGARIYVGTQAGLLVSTNGGATFAPPAMPGIPAGEAMVSFAGAKEAGALRFFCITWGSGDVYPGVQGASYDSYRGMYLLNGGTGTWTAVTGGIGANKLFLVDASPTNTAIAYAAGSDGSGQPSVVKTVNGGGAWTQVMRCSSNANVATGWSGDDPNAWNWKKWSFGECAMGFTVCASDPQRAVLTDLSFVHVTTNGGATWRQAYVWEGQENPAGTATPKTNAYTGCGMEDTSCWWMEWPDSGTVFACFTDIRGMLSTNGGQSWMSPMTLPYNSTYQTVRQPGSGIIYAAASSVHDLYAWDKYCKDPAIDAGSGAVLYSTNRGATWATLKDFGRPVAGLATDPGHSNVLYATMVHSASGGVYHTTNLAAGAGAVWTRLAAPPRTEGHPYLIRVLNDGTLVCSYSARITSDFTASSGVFASTNGGASWEDRSAAGMRYYTKDVVIDPHDPAQNTWFAGVWGEWGASADLGGLYATTNRGTTWTRITTNLKAVGSCTLSPVDPDVLYVTTEDQGLWCSTNRRSATPAFVNLAGYPFRFPARVFFNPFDANEVWVTSFGNGLRLGRVIEQPPVFRGLTTGSNSATVTVEAASGETVAILSAEDLATPMYNWSEVARQRMFQPTHQVPVDAVPQPQRFYGATVR